MAAVGELSVPRIIDAVAAGRAGDVAELFFEYVAATLVETGHRAPASVAGLPAALHQVCLDPTAGHAVLLLALLDGGAVGCLGLRSGGGDTGQVCRLYVRPAHRGSGLGRALMAQLHTVAGEAGYRRLTLDVLPTRTGAIALYRDLGYGDCPPRDDQLVALGLDLRPAKPNPVAVHELDRTGVFGR